MTTIEYAETDQFYGQIRLRNQDKVMSDDDNDIICLRNVHKTYLLGVEGIPALRGVSLTVKRGEFIVIFGTSGGGKTTMLNLIGTIDKPTKGELKLCGEKITEKTADTKLAELRLNSLGFVFQTFNLLSALTAQENVEMPMVLAGRLSARERQDRAKSLLKKVGLGKRLDHFPAMLSGGEQQRVTIARAIANRPELLLLDEPTGDLDSYNSSIVLQMLCSLHEKGMTMVMVTHDVHLKMFADRVVWMRDGKIQRIEVVAEDQKKTARDQLRQDLEQFRARKKASKTGPKADEGRDAARPVELRQPSDYETSTEYTGQSKSREVLLSELAQQSVSTLFTAAAASSSTTTTTTTSKKKKKHQKIDIADDNSVTHENEEQGHDFDETTADEDDDDDEEVQVRTTALNKTRKQHRNKQKNSTLISLET